MKKQVKFTVDVPDEATEDEIRDWLEFEVGASCCSSQQTIKIDLHADSNSVEID